MQGVVNVSSHRSGSLKSSEGSRMRYERLAPDARGEALNALYPAFTSARS